MTTQLVNVGRPLDRRRRVGLILLGLGLAAAVVGLPGAETGLLPGVAIAFAPEILTASGYPPVRTVREQLLALAAYALTALGGIGLASGFADLGTAWSALLAFAAVGVTAMVCTLSLLYELEGGL